jgi:16S rRNA (cytosine967-C5)-methyltransferase
MTNPRQIAFIALRDVHKGAYADVALDRVLQKVNLSDSDRLYCFPWCNFRSN